MSFNKKIMVSLTEEQYKLSQQIVVDNQDKYSSLSHYIRCAIIQKNKNETNTIK